MSLETDPAANIASVNASDRCNTDTVLAVSELLAAATSTNDLDLDLDARTTRSESAKGDFYSYQPTRYGSLMIVGDVGGAGHCPSSVMQLVPAAIAQAVDDHHEPDPFAVLGAVAAVLYRELLDHGAIATLCVATWDESAQSLAVSHAGRTPLLCASGSGVRQLEPADAPIGTSPQLVGVPEIVSLAPGDFLLIGTDGLVDQENKAGMEFGVTRLAQALLDGRGLGAKEVVATVFDMVADFGSGTPQLDDRTAMVITRPV